jgi:murein DD-endopeptidase MepM/ murein hydrolase activator NlpD
MKKSLIKILLITIVAVLSFGFYLYQAEPDFYLDRFYARIYSERLWAEPVVLLNETPVFFDRTGEEWSIQKKNGEWYTLPIEPDENDRNSYQPMPVATVSSLEDKLTVVVDKEPDRVSLSMIDTGADLVVLEEEAALLNLPLPKQNGHFIYELTMEWTGGSSPYRGKYILEIPVTAELPENFVFSAQQLTQGELLEVTVYYADDPDDIVFEQSIFSKFRWHQLDGSLRGYLPTNYNVKPGIYEIRYGVESKGAESTQKVEILARDYKIQYLIVDPQTEQETRNDAAYAEYYKYYTPVRNQSEPSRYYTDSFIWPVNGKLTTEFGETRYVNDFPTTYRHQGLDLAAPSGTAVKATNRGKVVLSRSLILTGNTVMIDHGEGLFSVYHHMNSLSVNIGDIVERGQKIGEVGSTGFSTGPHLHFMISYYTTNLEPGYFIIGEPIKNE